MSLLTDGTRCCYCGSRDVTVQAWLGAEPFSPDKMICNVCGVELYEGEDPAQKARAVHEIMADIHELQAKQHRAAGNKQK